jgi:hypothetical protein
MVMLGMCSRHDECSALYPVIEPDPCHPCVLFNILLITKLYSIIAESTFIHMRAEFRLHIENIVLRFILAKRASFNREKSFMRMEAYPT